MGKKLAKGVRITGDQRVALSAELAQRYVRGESIRTIADDIGRSYGFVHRVLSQNDIPLRARGGASRPTP